MGLLSSEEAHTTAILTFLESFSDKEIVMEESFGQILTLCEARLHVSILLYTTFYSILIVSTRLTCLAVELVSMLFNNYTVHCGVSCIKYE